MSLLFLGLTVKSYGFVNKKLRKGLGDLLFFPGIISGHLVFFLADGGT